MPPVMQSPELSNDQIIENFNLFFETTRKLLEVSIEKVKENPSTTQPEAIFQLEVLIYHLFLALNRDRIGSDLLPILTELDNDDRLALQLLALEMYYFHLKYQDINVGTSDFTIYKGLDDAKTITGSIKALIDKLPKWLKKILEVLSEVLGLAKNILPLL